MELPVKSIPPEILHLSNFMTQLRIFMRFRPFWRQRTLYVKMKIFGKPFKKSIFATFHIFSKSGGFHGFTVCCF